MYSFHPREVALCGASGSGKTTLATRLLERLSSEFDVGYAKHSDCAFDIDAPGKDTYRAREAGAKEVAIHGRSRFAAHGNTALDFVSQRTLFSNTDFVIAEGWKDGPLPRLILIEDNTQAQSIVAEATKRSGEILAWITPDASVAIDSDRPTFARDDVEGIARFISDRFRSAIEDVPLYGLVLAGGKSSRMRTDKASLTYGGKAQLLNAFELLAAVTEKTFISARQGQWDDNRFSDYPTIADKYQGLGPMSGILSAMAEHPEAAWVILACDLPFTDPQTLSHLIAQRDRFKLATAYISANDGLPEPLCAIYEPGSKSRLWQFVSLGYSCPRKLLINSHVKLIDLQNRHALDNVNHPEEYTAASSRLGHATP